MNEHTHLHKTDLLPCLHCLQWAIQMHCTCYHAHTYTYTHDPELLLLLLIVCWGHWKAVGSTLSHPYTIMTAVDLSVSLCVRYRDSDAVPSVLCDQLGETWLMSSDWSYQKRNTENVSRKPIHFSVHWWRREGWKRAIEWLNRVSEGVVGLALCVCVCPSARRKGLSPLSLTPAVCLCVGGWINV